MSIIVLLTPRQSRHKDTCFCGICCVCVCICVMMLAVGLFDHATYAAGWAQQDVHLWCCVLLRAVTTTAGCCGCGLLLLRVLFSASVLCSVYGLYSISLWDRKNTIRNICICVCIYADYYQHVSCVRGRTDIHSQKLIWGYTRKHGRRIPYRAHMRLYASVHTFSTTNTHTHSQTRAFAKVLDPTVDSLNRRYFFTVIVYCR